MKTRNKFLAHAIIIGAIGCLLARVCPAQQAGEVAPEIFAKRRAALLEQMRRNTAAVFYGAEYNEEQGPERFWQDNYFYYLTGFEEPHAAMILIPDAEQKYILFVERAIPEWAGKRCGVEGATTRFGADLAYSIDQFEAMAAYYLRGKRRVYGLPPSSRRQDNVKLTELLGKVDGPRTVTDIKPLVDEMRLIKDEYELELMRQAIEITCEAHRNVLRMAQAGMNEAEIQSIIEGTFLRGGARRLAFRTICGSGPFTEVLHYNDNNRKTEDGDMIVMDIGAKYGNYCGDVTRSIPLNGKFTKEQREIYELVLKANQETLAMVAPGVGIGEVEGHPDKVIANGLFRLGLITDRSKTWQTRVWLTHGTSHWLGLYVHDVGDYQRRTPKGRLLEPGMVFTVEPGIYFGKDSLNRLRSGNEQGGIPPAELSEFIRRVEPVFKKYINIGVRIEDNVLVTESGHEVLSKSAPKTLADIERLMGER